MSHNHLQKCNSSFHTTVIQEAIYETLLLQGRRCLHLQVASAIEELFKDRRQDHVESRALRYAEADPKVEAYVFLWGSGFNCKRTFSNDTAKGFFTQASDIARTVKRSKSSLKKDVRRVIRSLGVARRYELCDRSMQIHHRVIRKSTRACNCPEKYR